MIFIGIDPGVTGGISIVFTKGEFSIDEAIANEVPLTSDRKIDCRHIFEDLKEITECCLDKVFCVIEKAQSMPGQGAPATFNYGVTYGKLLSILDVLRIPYQEVHPMKWKKEFQLVKKSKHDSAAVASKLFPAQNFLTERGRLMDGKAESLLLAEYARRIYSRGGTND